MTLREANVRVVGLTGGIASGKSLVGRALADLGAEVVDADQVAREVVAPGQPALDEIVARFGRRMLLPDGTLDRKRLGALVFADEEARLTLNRITHPRIAAETARRIADAGARGVDLVIYEATLIVENQLHRGFAALIVVSATEELQVRRAIERDRLDEQEVRRRIAAQAPLADKLAVADYVIDNSGALDDTLRQVEELWRKLRGRNRASRRGRPASEPSASTTRSEPAGSSDGGRDPDGSDSTR